jgi:hypothetical protein
MHASQKIAVTLAAVAALAAPLPAVAQELLTFADPDAILNAAKGFGSATLETDTDGNPLISGRIQGVKYNVYFYSCTNGADCLSVQLAAGYTGEMPNDRVNEWNTSFRWVKLYSQNGANFAMDIMFSGGITPAALEEQFAMWDSFIPEIKTFMSQ